MKLTQEQIDFLISKEYAEYEQVCFKISLVLFGNHSITYQQFIKKIKDNGIENDLLYLLSLPKPLIKKVIDKPEIYKKLIEDY